MRIGMASKVGTYLNKVYQALPLLEEILQTQGNQVSRNRGIELATRIETIENSKQASEYIDILIEYQPQPILEASELDTEQLLIPDKLKSLIQWITKRLQLESANQLKAIIQDIQDGIQIIEDNLNGERKLSKIDNSIRAIDRSRKRLQELAVNNLEAIESSIREIESSAQTWFMRQEMAQEIQQNHIYPMGQIIAIDGLMHQTVNLAAGKLRDIEKNALMPSDLIGRARNLRRAMDDTLSIVLNQHRDSLGQVSHLLISYSKKPSRTMLGAIEALRLIETRGIKKLEISKRLHINTWKLNEIWNDENLFYLLAGLSEYEPNVELFQMPDEDPELIPFLSSSEIISMIQDNEQVEDILEFVLQKYPKQKLSTCVDVTLDIISKYNGDILDIGIERKIHSHNGEKIEVMPIGIK
jgi:hypothetical protein